jgi:hypothetical protein
MALKLIGTCPAYGMKAEKGMLVESMQVQHNSEWYESKGPKGRIEGKMLIDEHQTVTLSGAEPLDPAESWKMGDTLTLANTLPMTWCQEPTATVSIITDISYNYSNSDAVKKDVTVEVWAFGETNTEG